MTFKTSLPPTSASSVVETFGAFVLSLFVGALIWVYSKKVKWMKKFDYPIESEVCPNHNPFLKKSSG